MARAVHVVASGTWLGLVVAMLSLGVSAALAASPERARTSYRPMVETISATIPPVAVAALLTGLGLSLLTSWGVVRHWWVVAKLIGGLLVITTSVLLGDRWLAAAIVNPDGGGAGARIVAQSLAHTLVLAAASVISVDKPWGRTPWASRSSTDT